MRQDFEKIALKNEIPFYGFWLSGDVELNRERIDERQRRRESGVRDITTISAVSPKNIDPSLITGQVSWTGIDMSLPADAVFKAILEYLPVADIQRPSRRCEHPKMGRNI